MLSHWMLCKKLCMSAILRVNFLYVNYCMYFSTAEAVLQEMDNINIRRNRRSGEVERLRMWTDTEFVSAQCLRSWLQVISRGSMAGFAISIHLSVTVSKGCRFSSMDNVKISNSNSEQNSQINTKSCFIYGWILSAILS